MPPPSDKIEWLFCAGSGDCRTALREGQSFYAEGPLIEFQEIPKGHYVAIFDDDKPTERGYARLTRLLWDQVPFVIGPKASTNELFWDLKPEVDARGGILEIASTPDDFNRRLSYVKETYRLRLQSRRTAGQDHDQLLQDVVKNALAEFFGQFPAQFGRGAGAISSFTAKESASDPLAGLPGIVAATQVLRSDRGRLDTGKIADLFGTTRAELARQLAVQPQKLSATPDSPSVQDKLRVFEQIARLLAVVRTPENFRKWLNTANPELGDVAPLAFIKEKGPDNVALLVENILTNRGR